MKKIYMLFLGLAISAAAPASAQDAYLQDEINRIKEDIVVMQRQLYREKNDTTAPQESVSNFQVRLGEYDQMIRDMNGKVENIEYRLNTLEKKIEMIDKDIELRFKQMQRQSNAAPAPVKNTQAAAKPATQALAGMSAKELYDSGLADIRNNKLVEAEAKFTQFLSSYPKDGLAENAQYWLGEVYYKQQDFAKAAVAFKEGYTKYPEGTKGPDCLLKLGLSMKALNKKQEACTAFTNLPTIFGKVNAEISERAKKEAEALACN